MTTSKRFIRLGYVALFGVLLVAANWLFEAAWSDIRTGPLPVLLDDGWSVNQTAAGFNQVALHQTLTNALEEPFNIHSIIVERHGKLVAEYYQTGPDRSVYALWSRPQHFEPTTLHDVRSVGKSVTSLLFGIAAAQYPLLHPDTVVADLYSDQCVSQRPAHQSLKISHLLTMSSGLDWQEGAGIVDDEIQMFWRKDLVCHVLNRGITTQPGGSFGYNSGATALLADLIVRHSGLSLPEFADRFLLTPMNIKDWQWATDLHGRAMAFNGLRLRPRDLVKIGRLVLNNGRWHGQQLVPESWIKDSLQPRLATGVSNFQYGYQWWTGTVIWPGSGQSLQWQAGFGNGGQRLFVVPALDLVVVTTAGAYGDIETAKRVNLLLQQIVNTVLTDGSNEHER
ncbi:serine hydrolase domain-containing protein [Rheinheimera riviphila]|uniref:serine hydrolase domain-containing protein n=1 Tax=Rheinheimera riviphila TaxID=1834037 RepID=UPI0013E2939D|nr:serine hydrolase [Rheinheimera riviphila]